MSNEQAKTILQYLGGSHFTTMVGAKKLIAIENGLQLDFMRNASKARTLRVTYNEGEDTYTMQFIKKGTKCDVYSVLNKTMNRLLKKYSCTFDELKDNHEEEFNEAYDKAIQKAQSNADPKIIKEFTGCFFDDLRRIFEQTTQLRTSLIHTYA